MRVCLCAMLRCTARMAVPLLLVLTAGAVRADVDFGREVKPIFERHCYSCHGPAKQKSSYRLDVRSVAIRGGDFGETAIVGGDAAASPLLKHVIRIGYPRITERECRIDAYRLLKVFEGFEI